MHINAPRTKVQSVGQKKSLVASAGPGRLFQVLGYNNGGDQWLHIFDAAAVPSLGSQPLWSQKIYADREFYFEFGPGIPMTTGIVAATSSTNVTFTAAAAEDCLMTVTMQ